MSPFSTDLPLTFADLGLDPALLRAITDLGYTAPTAIQRDAIPHALAGRDLLACAQTGSGKTAGFVLPILQRLAGREKAKRARALVITPTRELAAQILADVEALGKHTRVRGAAIFGGVGMGPQEAAFRNGVEILVATPGRLLDHLKQPYASLADVEVVVFDEADRMLDMGFLPEIRKIVRHLPTERQALLFSATMPEPIAKLAQEFLRKPVPLNIERQSTPASSITQVCYPVPQDLKTALLIHLLEVGHMEEVLVFTRTKHRADRVCKQLVKHGISAERIHGNRSQPQRTAALAGFKDGTYRVLVATDIVARGIDITALGHVLNLDVPVAPEDYIHRIGRTGRAAETGDAITFVAPDEEPELRAIERVLGKKVPRAKAEGFDYSARPAEKLEIPLEQRIAEIRARKAQERARAKEKAAR
ncbi:MAG TPA: DEAD/DEAH box helicase, partial [Gemmatimonadales bacterium]|nr:DEAD/DEAH box helicase [Gemmatimonadales bacterium]